MNSASRWLDRAEASISGDRETLVAEDAVVTQERPVDGLRAGVRLESGSRADPEPTRRLRRTP